MKNKILIPFLIALFVSNTIYSQNIYIEYLHSRKMSENSKKLMPKGMYSFLSKPYLYIINYKDGEYIYENHPKSLNVKPFDTIYVDNGVENKETLSNNNIEKSYYINTLNKEILYIHLFNNNFIYIKDNLIDFNWSITDEKKVINNLNCKKATSFVKNVNINVWFTEDIPIDCGPYFFNGLPGLIVYAENNHSIYEMKKIVNNTTINIKKPDFKDKNTITIDELENNIMKYYKNINTTTEETKEGNTTTKKTKKVITN